MPDASGTGIYLPNDHKEILKRGLDLIEACTASTAARAAQARQLYSITETGRDDGSRSKINKLYKHLDRLQSHLYSPTDLHFTVDFEYSYPKDILEKAIAAAKILTRDFERTNTDTLFGQGVFEALRYGCCFLKQWVEEGDEGVNHYQSSLVMPWNLGVTNERNNMLSKQDAICEVITLTLPEVWKRICKLPDAKQLFEKIRASAATGDSGGEQNSFYHQVLSTAQLSSGVGQGNQTIPGGIVALNNNPNYALMGPTLGIDVVKMYEIWVRDVDDWKTIQIIEPDILVSPGPNFKPSNLLISGAEHSMLHPYTRICANETNGWMWGRPEVTDLTEPQNMLSTWADDTTRLYGLQVDRILGFVGGDGVQDEKYDQFRAAGYISLEQGSDIKDLTPVFPPESLQMLELASRTIDALGGFDNIMNGQGQPGVRSADQGELLKQMASPQIRDRSLLIERQCATAGDLRLALREAKDGHTYWTDGTNDETIEKTKFILNDLPEDRRVSVDSHSSSPIFRDQHTQLLFSLAKLQIIDGQDVLENIDLPNRDILIDRYKERQAKQAQMLQQLQKTDPEAFAKLLGHKGHK